MDRVISSHEPFKLGWYSIDLGQYRPCDSTYCLFPYESLPPIPAPDESLAWLTPLDEATSASMEIYRNAPDARGDYAAIAAQAAALGLTLPESFRLLMSSPELQNRIPSTTACYFELGARIVPCPGDPNGGYIVTFLHDQQDVLLWYLYLTPQGTQRVLVSIADLVDGRPEDYNVPPEQWQEAIQNNTFVCAPTFAEFIYRFNLENALWFRQEDGSDYTPAERAYLDHYARAGKDVQ